ncbi:MAG: hypothetical protein R3F65_29045 [bacterium]
MIRRCLPFALTLGLAAPALAQPSPEALQAQIEALASEVNRLRESLAVPEEEAKKSVFGLGPAASKVYAQDGLSIGGYGELFLGHALGDDGARAAHRGDVYRFIAYFGYKFDDRVVFNTEIEFEHATEAVVEFMYVDLLLSPWANLRTGLMLMPVGIVNEMHEPTTFRGNFRPAVERSIIPSTWREAGLMVFGALPAGLDYKLGVVSGLLATPSDGGGFGPAGIRGGRQNGSQFRWEDKAVVGRLEWSGDALTVGASGYYGGADQDPDEASEVTVLLYEAHAMLRLAGAELRGLFAESHIGGAETISSLEAGAVPEKQRGFYVEASYALGPVLGFERTGLSPFVRVERLDLQVEVPAGYAVDAGQNSTWVTAGLEYKPHPDVVFKGEYERVQSDVEAGEPVQELRLGVGFIF